MRATFLLFFLLAALAPPAAADVIRITEVVTDPQSDHSESAGGNGLPYDPVPGTGTVSSVDEFVELFNPGTAAVDLSGWRLRFSDSTPSEYTFGASSSGLLRFSAGSSLEELLPGGFVLLGNPPGALNNRLDLELLDARGLLVDAWSIEDGNASSPLDEAVVRVWTGTRFLGQGSRRDSITPLALPNPVPEPAALLLLSLLAAGAATRRTVRRARGRRRAEGR